MSESSVKHVAWFWYGLRGNTIDGPLWSPAPPNFLQRVFMRVVFGFVEVRW